MNFAEAKFRIGLVLKTSGQLERTRKKAYEGFVSSALNLGNVFEETLSSQTDNPMSLLGRLLTAGVRQVDSSNTNMNKMDIIQREFERRERWGAHITMRIQTARRLVGLGG